MEKLPQDIEDINSRLVSRFGKTPYGEPRFRLVWSENELEHRKVEYLRGVRLIYPEVVQTRKYSYISDRYILEKWFDTNNPELVTTHGGTYEPLWIFEDKDFNPLRPIFRVVEILCEASDKQVGVKKSMKDLMSEDEKELEKEVEYFESMLGDNEYKNQEVNYVKPLYLNTDYKGK